MSRILVFVYGTLKEGNGLHRVLQAHKAIQVLKEAITEESKFDIVDNGGFPYVFSNGQFRIKGEVYEVSPDLLQELDYIEGHPRHYVRTPTKITGLDEPVFYYDGTRQNRDDWNFANKWIRLDADNNIKEWVRS